MLAALPRPDTCPPSLALSCLQGAHTLPRDRGRGQGASAEPTGPKPVLAPFPHALGNVWLFFKLIPLLPARSDRSVQHRQGCGPEHGEEGLFEGSKQRTGLGCCRRHRYQGGRQTKLYMVARAIPTPRILEACCVHSNWTHLSDPLNLVIIFVSCFAKIHIQLSFNDNATVVP